MLKASTISRKKRQGKCLTPYCGNKAVKGKNYCSKCRHKRYKQNDPMAYSYQTHKANARRRKPAHHPSGIPFTLTFEEFLALWQQYPDQLAEKRQALSSGKKCRWEIDRIDPFKGYEAGNVRIVHKTVNVAYWNNWYSDDDNREWYVSKYVMTVEEKANEFADVPF